MRRLLIIILALVALVVVADRVTLAAAQARLAAVVQKEEDLADRPAVHLNGLPFLTQAIRGEYDGGRIEIRGLRTEKVRVSKLVVDLRDVTVPLSDLVSGNVGDIPAGSVSGTALITYADLAAASGVPGLRIRPKGDRLELTSTVSLFGAEAPIVATARVEVVDQAVRMTSVQVQGVALPKPVAAAVARRMQEKLSFGDLPYGLKLTGVRVAESGVEVSAQARNTVLHKPS